MGYRALAHLSRCAEAAAATLVIPGPSRGRRCLRLGGAWKRRAGTGRLSPALGIRGGVWPPLGLAGRVSVAVVSLSGGSERVC